MGNPRPKPKRLAEKLRAIRAGLGLSQTRMLKRLEHESTMHYGRISEYEAGKREPTLMTILQYARVAGVHMEDVVDDELDLPAKLPGKVRYKGVTHKPVSTKKLVSRS
jgi:transcriptional regulator with XRE-family HTH domain